MGWVACLALNECAGRRTLRRLPLHGRCAAEGGELRFFDNVCQRGEVARRGLFSGPPPSP